MPTTKFNYFVYTRPVRLYARGAIVLGHRLLRTAPAKPSKAVKARLVELRTAAEGLKSEHSARASRSTVNVKPVDRSFDSGWVALRDSLQVWQGNDHPDAAELRALAAALELAYFPSGVTFTQLSYEEEWAESAERIGRWTKDPAVRKDLVKVSHELHVANVERQHEWLSEALNLSGKLAPKGPEPRGIAEAMSVFAEALSEYIRVFGAELNTKDAKSVARFVDALAPLESYRASTAIGQNRDDAEEQEDLDAELPPVPGGGEPDEDPDADDDGGEVDEDAEKDAADPAAPKADGDTPAVKPGMRGGSPFKE